MNRPRELGLRRDHARRDTPTDLCENGRAQIQRPESDSIRCIGSYDAASVTSYCAASTELISKDIDGLELIQAASLK